MAFLRAYEKQQMMVRGIKRIFLGLKRAMHFFLDLALFPKCLKCGGLVTDAHNICPGCWRGIHFISSPMCDCYGYHFGPELGGVLDEVLCGACQKAPRSFDKVISGTRMMMKAVIW
jgi:hypothetical protein